MQEELDEEYMGLYAPGQMMNDCLYGQISYNSSPSHAFKLNLEPNLKLYLVEMKAATGKDIVEHIFRPLKVIPASLDSLSYAPQLIRKVRLQREPMEMKDCWMKRRVGMRLIVVLM